GTASAPSGTASAPSWYRECTKLPGLFALNRKHRSASGLPKNQIWLEKYVKFGSECVSPG
ncbi:MAG TPA: hypothetical protein PLB32_08415, partial [Acidobacteriota bacterium]|nr:hypothetical protein [Acidobacteriota bacterium]